MAAADTPVRGLAHVLLEDGGVAAVHRGPRAVLPSELGVDDVVVNTPQLTVCVTLGSLARLLRAIIRKVRRMADSKPQPRGLLLVLFIPLALLGGCSSPPLANSDGETVLRVRFVDALTGEPAACSFALYAMDLPPDPDRALPGGDERVGIFEAMAEDGARVSGLQRDVQYRILPLDAATGTPCTRVALNGADTSLSIRVPIPRPRLLALRLVDAHGRPIQRATLEKGWTSGYAGFRDPSWLRLRSPVPSGCVPADGLGEPPLPVESACGLYHVPVFVGDSRNLVDRRILTFRIDDHFRVLVNPGAVVGPVIHLTARTTRPAEVLAVLRRPDGSPPRADEVTLRGRVSVGLDGWRTGPWIAENRDIDVEVLGEQYKAVRFRYPVDGRKPPVVRLEPKDSR